MIVVPDDDDESDHFKHQVWQIATPPLAPIHKLPTEILRKIFIAHGARNFLISSTRVIPGFKIAAICSHWRSIAIETADLWNTIRIDLPNRTVEKPDYVALVEHLLKLSCKSKLDIEINSHDWPNATAPECLLLLCKESDRWQRLSGYCDPSHEDILNALVSSLQGHLDSLEAFEIIVPCTAFNALVKGAPNLRTLAIGFDDDIGNSSILQDLPCTKVTHLTFHQQYLSDILQFILHFPNLHSLVLYHIFPNVDGLPEHRVYSDLHSLRIDVEKEGANPLAEIFASSTFPKLQSLSIYSRNNNDEEICTTLSSYISRSSAILTTLSFEGVSIATEDLTSSLKNMPNLTTLLIASLIHFFDPERRRSFQGLWDMYGPPDRLTMLNDHLLSNLLVQYLGHQTILPRLTSLTLERQLLSMFSITLFLQVIQSRWNPSVLAKDNMACIKTVKLQVYDGPIDREVVRSLRLLRTEGLNISIEDINGEVPLWEEE